MASKIAQNKLEMHKMASDMPPRSFNIAPRRLQVAREPPEEAPKRPESFEHPCVFNVFCLLALSLPMGSSGLKMAPRWPKRAPREAQEGPKTATRAPKIAPRAAQEGPETAFLSLRGGDGN